MSMEAALDEERRSVLALLEGANQNPRAQRGSSSSHGSERAPSPFANPRSPVRSMLDIAEEHAPRHASIAGSNAGVAVPTRSAPIRSMLDIGTPGPQSSRSAQTSPTDPNAYRNTLNVGAHPRSMSDAASRLPPSDFGPRALGDRHKGDPMGYQFSNYLPSNPGGPIVPKRNTLAGKKVTTSAMAEAMKGSDLSGLLPSRDRGRHHSIATTGIGNKSSSKSQSPHNRLGLRSNSPHSSTLGPNKIALDNGTIVDMNTAFRRLSDANLALSGGSLATLSAKGRRRTNSGDAIDPHDERLVKDYSFAEEDAVGESSEDDHPHSSDDEHLRGRKKTGRADANGQEQSTLGMGRAKGHRQAYTLMAAADEERQEIADQQKSKYKVRSLLEPEITVTGPSGDRLKNSKPGIHPTTAFDQGGVSGLTTPLDSDTEADITDIKRAQKLAVLMTPISSTPDTGRCVRTIYRGDFAEMQREAGENQRRIRKYLVATDLSDEAAHALEWTVGTVLRDGDTLLAIYCVDEETGIHRPDGTETPVSDAGSTITTQAALIAATTNKLQTAHIAGATSHIAPSPLGAGSTSSTTASPMGRARSHAEEERYRAVQDITDRVARLLRKTRLQVRVVIEVIHCKSPKHLITEVIDFISPTLVILGSRGRSNLKGVILGSFSNYLVTKSSVPVMVARKRLRKHSKYKRPSVRLANNLATTNRGLMSARVDEFVK